MLRSYSRNTGSTSLDSETQRAGHLLGEDRGDAPLVRGVGVAVQQHDGDRADALRRDRPRGGAHRRLVERLELARRPAPMRPPTSKMCSGGTGRFGFTQANRLARRGTSWRPISSTYLKPAVVMSAARRALALEDQVGGDRRAVQHAGDVGAGEARGLQHLGDAVAEAPRGIVRRRRRLGGPDAAGRRVEQRDVGEGAAGVDADDDARRW